MSLCPNCMGSGALPDANAALSDTYPAGMDTARHETETTVRESDDYQNGYAAGKAFGMDAARAKAIEECARVCEELTRSEFAANFHELPTAIECADAIRALATKAAGS